MLTQFLHSVEHTVFSSDCEIDKLKIVMRARTPKLHLQ